MFLPEKSSFPPEQFFFNKFEEWGTWYSGESQYLVDYYTRKVATTMKEDSLFWAKIEQEERVNAIHIPVAGDIAGMSANLLFSESPRIIINNMLYSDIINYFIKENGFDNLILEGAEIASAFGGVLLKLDIDSQLSDFPILSCLTPLQFLPTFKMGRLNSILMWRDVLIIEDKDIYYRLFEDRTRKGNNLNISFKLYKGNQYNVGFEIDLNSIDDPSLLNLNNFEISNVRGLGCIYIPNMKPNKLAPGSMIGINDFNSSIPLMDGLDSIWSSWMNDIELGRGQIFLDEELLQRDDSLDGSGSSSVGRGSSFSKFKKCFINLNLSSYKMSNDNVKPLDVHQFDIRTDDHLKACIESIKTIIGNCGYSPQSFGIDVTGQAESGTALRIKEGKSVLTSQKKARYWQPQINDLLRQMVALYYAYNNKDTRINDPSEITVELEDSIPINTKELSETIRNLDMAKAVSTYIKVKMQHPDWSEDDITLEVDRITKETGADLNNDNFDLTNYMNKDLEEELEEES
jgi:A118 family predicted phage portal protein